MAISGTYTGGTAPYVWHFGGISPDIALEIDLMLGTLHLGSWNAE
jgi:hypothetical protein